MPVGEALLGRMVDPLGRPLDGRAPIVAARATRRARGARIVDRDLVTEPLQTGVSCSMP